MKVSGDEIKIIADLAKLRLDQAEAIRFQSELGMLLDQVFSLAGVNGEQISDCNNSDTNSMRFRTDQIQPSLPKDYVLKNGPAVSEGMFSVPKVI